MTASQSSYSVALLPGDGIGPEIVAQAKRVLVAAAELAGVTMSFEEGLIGGAAIDSPGSALPDETTAMCKRADAVLLGAVGGPKWDNPSAKVRPEQGLLTIRKALGLYANLRPISVYPALIDASPLKPEIVEGVDFVVVRELTGGIYFGKPSERRQENGEWVAVDTLVYKEHEIERVVRLAFETAKGRKGKVASVDKANVLESSRLWRNVATRIGTEYPDVELE